MASLIWCYGASKLLVVNPNATDAEVAEVVNGNQDVQIFAQAAMGNRYADAQRAYREVADRREEIKRIERNLIELAQLFSDVSLLESLFLCFTLMLSRSVESHG